MANINYSIFHYHLERGGVTQVVDMSVRAMVRHLQGVEAIQLVAGRAGGGSQLAFRLENECRENGVELNLTVIPEMDYLPLDTAAGAEADRISKALKKRLIDECAGSVWLVHNFHLGKNPLFTQALLEIASEDPNQRLCMYIHDFPECARYENLSFLRRFVKVSPYPVSGNVRYAVINSRDKSFLHQAGVPEEDIFLVNNPVPRDSARPVPGYKQKLESAFSGDFPAYRKGAPMLLYPIRTIRRKNVLELGLLTAISPSPLNLVTTLPGTSETEMEYSKAVEEAFDRGLIPGMCGIGMRLDDVGLSFPGLMMSADIIGSSSVQEGFGYLFFDAVQMGKPLLARHLDILDGLAAVFDNQTYHFYKKLWVTLDKDEAAKLREMYKGKIDRFEKQVGKPVADRLVEGLAGVISDHRVEFSFLTVQQQVNLLEKIKHDSGYADGVRDMNSGHIEAMQRLIDGDSDSHELDEWPFSFQAYADSIAALTSSFNSREPFSLPSNIQANLVQRFANIGYFRMIYSN